MKAAIVQERRGKVMLRTCKKVFSVVVILLVLPYVGAGVGALITGSGFFAIAFLFLIIDLEASRWIRDTASVWAALVHDQIRF